MFGGAGGQHACSIASTLGIKRIIIPRLSSLLSAYGMALADVVRELTEPAAFTVSGNKDNDEISGRISSLVKKAEEDLRSQGFPPERIEVETYLNCRYHGTSTQLMIERPEDGNYEQTFFEQHKREFGFNLENRNILVDDLRVRAVGRSLGAETRSPYKDYEQVEKRLVEEVGDLKKVYFDPQGWMDTRVVALDGLKPGDQVRVRLFTVDSHVKSRADCDRVQQSCTIRLRRSWWSRRILSVVASLISSQLTSVQATSLPEHVVIDLVEEKVIEKKVDLTDYDHVDPVQLSVYGHRLMGIAEQVS